jgi:hypothetical protein
MSNKTISINTSYFTLGGSKTKKNKEKKEKSVIKPLINPNILKNKFLKRIKEHKQQEMQNLENNKKEKENNIPVFTDEFSDSINYLQTLSKQKKVNDEKIIYEKQKQRRKAELERKTLKNYNEYAQNPIQNQINIDLPEELRLEMYTQATNPLVLNKPEKDNIPYGILKGGIKPTYRNWTRTQRNNIVVNPNAALTIQNNELNKEKLERELRLQSLREKLKNKQQEELLKKTNIVNPTTIIPSITNIPITEQAITQNTIESISNPNPIQSISNPNPIQSISNPNPIQSISNPNPIQSISNPIQSINDSKLKETIIATKKITKKTIKRKYTLGKSKIKKAVGILVKDRGTRKQIISAQRDLKKKNINDVKAYLRDHNLIKIGSNAPNDVIRKIYESAMLSGEITNSNSEILLHNLSKEEKQL